MEEQQKHIDDLFREELGNYAETPPAAVWDALEPRLEDARKRRPFGGWWPWIVMLLLVGTVAGFFIVRNSAKKGTPDVPVINKELANNEIATIKSDSSLTEKANTATLADTQTYRTHYDAAAVHLDKNKPQQGKKLHKETPGANKTTSDLNTISESNNAGSAKKAQQQTGNDVTQENADNTATNTGNNSISGKVKNSTGTRKTKQSRQQAAHTPVQNQNAGNNISTANNTDNTDKAAPGSTPDKIGAENAVNSKVTAKNKKVSANQKPSIAKAAAVPKATNLATPDGEDNAASKNLITENTSTTAAKKNKKKTTIHSAADNTIANNSPATNNIATQNVTAQPKTKNNKQKPEKPIITAAATTTPKNNTIKKASTGKKTGSKAQTAAVNNPGDTTSAASKTTNNKQTPQASDNSNNTTVATTNSTKKKTAKTRPTTATPASVNNTGNSSAVVPATGSTIKNKNTKQSSAQKANTVAPNDNDKKQPITGNNNNQKKTNNTPTSANPTQPQSAASSKEETKAPISVTPAPNEPKTARQTPVNEIAANKPQQIAEAENAPPKAKPERDPRAGIPVSDYLGKSEENTKKPQKTGEADEEEQKVTAAATGNGGGGGQTAQPTRKPHNPSQLEGGAKIGYEKGFNSYTANKWVGALYLQYNLSKKASFVIQPAVKLAQTNSSSTSNSNQSYYKVTGTNVSHVAGGVQFDSTTGRFDTLYNYTYKQNYDSIGVKKTVARNYVEIEIPIIFKYEVAPNFSLLAGLTMNFGALPKTTEGTTTYGSYVLQDTVNNIKNNANYQISVNDSFAHTHTSAPYSSYTPTSDASSSPIRFGYILGMNYILKDRFLFDVTVQQNFSKQTGIQNTDVRSLLTQPYVRIMVGYRFFKPKKKVLE